MPESKPKPASEMTTEDAVKHLFPKKAREAVRAEAEKSKKPEKSTKQPTK